MKLWSKNNILSKNQIYCIINEEKIYDDFFRVIFKEMSYDQGEPEVFQPPPYYPGRDRHIFFFLFKLLHTFCVPSVQVHVFAEGILETAYQVSEYAGGHDSCFSYPFREV